MENKLYVSPAPHITGRINTITMMFAMIFALLPTAILGCINFGVKALFIILISTGSAYVFELLFRVATKKKIFWYDFSSVVTGFMVGLVLPVSVPYWFPVLASFIAIIIFRNCFGGLGRNLFNPTAGARVVLGFIFSGLSLAWFKETTSLNVSSPLEYFISGDYSSVTIRSMFFGSTAGAIGTVCIICILVSGIVLMCFKISDWVAPCCAMLSFVVAVWIGSGAISIVPFLFTGSFLFATMFMLPDPATSPCSVWGRFVYGILFGIFAGLFRCFHIFGETSVFVAILMVNLVSPMLDKIFAPRPLGIRRSA